MDAPGMIAPEGSATWPRNVPVVFCANPAPMDKGKKSHSMSRTSRERTDEFFLEKMGGSCCLQI